MVVEQVYEEDTNIEILVPVYKRTVNHITYKNS